jgi:ATP-dependent helicase HrpA
MTSPSPASRLEADLPLAMAADAAQLASRIERARRMRAPAAEWQKIAAALTRSVERRKERAARRPPIAYPLELPVAQRADEIARAIETHQVVIVSGETGSGKTTQLPKICIAAGRGERGLIGHTQPRRIAARSVAARIAQELGSEVGDAVGYKVRFTDRTKPDAFIKLMTDGILLAETQGDPLLAAYDTLIVDEAHERSLNIDFLLGYLKQLLARRPDLKVVVTSATLDADRFARHFGHGDKPAPVIEVSGRMYPIEIRYRPLATAEESADDEEELEDAIVDTADELWRGGPGDILVFLPGEREIRETADLLRRALARRPYANAVEILPLYARLSVPEQQRVFAPSSGRRIVLATNVAETSLTVPGIRYVIDSGVARVKRYSLRNKTTLLQIEQISQAAANQRAGALRTRRGRNLRASLQRRRLRRAPALYRSRDSAQLACRGDPADGGARARRRFRISVRRAAARTRNRRRLSAAAGARCRRRGARADAARRRALAPACRSARRANDRRRARAGLRGRGAGHRRCVIGARSARSAACETASRRPGHLAFRDDRSDFLSLIALWEFFEGKLAEKLTHRRLVEACRAQFVSYLRLREWRDVHHQLAAEIAELGWRSRDTLPASIDAAKYQALHKALLAGLLGNIGLKDGEGDGYQGARGIRFHLHPGSGLAKKRPKWVVAAELVETSRLYARCAAAIEPEWIETMAGERVTREYFEPHWDVDRGEVVASERVQLYGITLVVRRRVSFGRIDPATAREVFIREALVPGELATKGAFVAHNRNLVAEIGKLEHKARRQDVLVDDEAIAAFYEQRVPAGVHSAATFERWREQAERSDTRVLFLTREALMRHAALDVTETLFPEKITLAGNELPLRYRFAPGQPNDGLTLTVPLALLNQIDVGRLSWLVPGMIREKVTLLLKALPKQLRNRLHPLPDAVTAFLESVPYGEGPLTDALARWLRGRLRESIAPDLWDDVNVPPHLQMELRVIDASGRELATGRDVAALRAELGEAAQLSFAGAKPALERRGLKSWDFGTLPETLATIRNGQRITGYPALVDDGDSVSIALVDTQEAAQAAMRAGVIRLIRIALKDQIARYEKGAAGFNQAALQLKTTINSAALLGDVLAAICDRAFVGDDPLPRSKRRSRSR